MATWVQGYSPDALVGGAVNLDVCPSIVIVQTAINPSMWQLVTPNFGPISPSYTTEVAAQSALSAMLPDTTFSF